MVCEVVHHTMIIMDLKVMEQIFNDTAYVRTSGSPAELRCAEYLKEQCAKLGKEATIEEFEVDMATIQEVKFIVDGKEIPCTGYYCAGNDVEVEAPLYYMPHTDKYSMSQCKGKIVLLDGAVGFWLYKDLVENGAVGFVTYNGNVTFPDEDIDQKELRFYAENDTIIPAVCIHVKQAIELVKNNAKTAKIVLKQEVAKGKSHNVVMDIPGECDEFITFTAHYDSVPLSVGMYDNMSGCVGLLGIAEQLITKTHHYGLRFIWCGSEERGLLGSKAYASAHEEELKKAILSINLDMIGCVMGRFVGCATAEEKLAHYVEYMGNIEGFSISTSCDVYPSDSTPMADKGVPAITFARSAPPNTATIHNRYDTIASVSMEQMQRDIDFIAKFAETMADAKKCPVTREMPEKMKEKLDYYLNRKKEK